MKSKLFILSILLYLTIGCCFVNAQNTSGKLNQTIESLKLELKIANHDTTRVKILSELSDVCEVEDIAKYAEPCILLCEKKLKIPGLSVKEKYFYKNHLAMVFTNRGFLARQLGDITKALSYFQKSLKLNEEIKNKEGIVGSLNFIGTIYDNQGHFEKALEAYQGSLALAQQIHYKEGISTSLNNIGYLSHQTGDIAKAIENYHKCLLINEEIDDKQGIATSLNNIGFLIQEQGDYSKALEYYQKSLNIQEQLNNKEGITLALSNLGGLYNILNNPKKALEFHNKSLKIQEETNDKLGMAYTLNNLGIIYDKNGDLVKALELLQKSLTLAEETEDKQLIANLTSHIGTTIMNQGNLVNAHKYATRSLQLSNELGYPDQINNAAGVLKKIYQKQNKYKEALEMFELEIQMRDSIKNEANKKESIQKQFQYQYEKKAAADSVKTAEEKKVKDAQLLAQTAQLKQEKTQRFGLYAGLLFVLLFAAFIFNRLKVTKKQKKIIEEKEKETQEKNVIITQQKHIVEEKQKEILDSINYAKRIQNSLLAHKDFLDENLPDNFVFFKPKDIVSGDFYWATKHGNKFYLAVCDSTGHGVPGAFMSLLNIGFLSEAINEKNILEPHKIFNYVRQRLINSVSKDGQKDGFDGILLCINLDSKEITYASANNAPNLISENKFIELSKDKMPVGQGERIEEFTLYSIQPKKGDILYVYTDGYADQFGGPKGKKFKYKPLNELLLNNSNLSLQKQSDLLVEHFDNWKGNLEQVDDVCIVGIKI